FTFTGNAPLSSARRRTRLVHLHAVARDDGDVLLGVPAGGDPLVADGDLPHLPSPVLAEHDDLIARDLVRPAAHGDRLGDGGVVLLRERSRVVHVAGDGEPLAV